MAGDSVNLEKSKSGITGDNGTVNGDIHFHASSLGSISIISLALISIISFSIVLFFFNTNPDIRPKNLFEAAFATILASICTSIIVWIVSKAIIYIFGKNSNTIIILFLILPLCSMIASLNVAAYFFNQSVSEFIEHVIKESDPPHDIKTIFTPPKIDNVEVVKSDELYDYKLYEDEVYDYHTNTYDYFDKPISKIGKLDMKFMLIRPKPFNMGSLKNEKMRDEDEKQHKVKLTKNFSIQITEVTVKQWKMFVNDTGYETEAETGNGAFGWNNSKWEKSKKYYWNSPGFEQTDAHPVTCISWNDVQAFIKWLNQEDSSYSYRLPTEAEWEYSARAGKKLPFHFGICLSTDHANYDGNYPMTQCNIQEYRQKTTPVKSFEPNYWGIYNMHGNVFEWCQDWYGEYQSDEVKNPVGPETGSFRVIRGGSWISQARHCRSSYRYKNQPDYRRSDTGFRLVLTPRLVAKQQAQP